MRYEISTHENFDESRYLFSNPDVLDGINRGEFKTAFEHFEQYGYSEGRCQKLKTELDAPLGIVHIPKCAGTSLREEINLFHLSIYKGQKYFIRGRRKSIFPTRSLEKESKLESSTWTLEQLHEARDQYQCVMGHISLNDFQRSGFRDFVVIVREPRIRLFSEMVFLNNHKEYSETLRNLHGVYDYKSYLSKYARVATSNSITNYSRPGVIFDWEAQTFNVSCYWSDEIGLLMSEIFGKREIGIKSNVTSKEVIDIDYKMLDLVHQLTEKDSVTLDRLMNSGLLSDRSREKMEEEFQRYLKTRFNYVRSLI